ncbi:MAG TPA: class I SAM-dependent methyltransferase [Armatimonadota bacterium]|jgi:SAM-dependent methyltransferase
MSCRLCGDNSVSEHFTAQERLVGFGGSFDYSVCGACGSAQITEIPEDLGRYYAGGYYSFQPPPNDRWPLGWLKRCRNAYEVFGAGVVGRRMDARAPNIYMRGLRTPGIDRNWRILDVGCGAGQHTSALGDIGFTRVTGTDPFIPEDIAYPNGVHIRKVGVEELEGQWDLVYLHHSFEHVPDPRATFASVSRLVAPGGWLVISAPVFPNAAWERYGVHWVQLDAPRHLTLPSERAIAALARAAGLTMEAVEYNGNDFQFWGSEQYRHGLPLAKPGQRLYHPAAGLFTPKQMAEWRRQADRLNAEGLGDQAIFRMRAK